VSIEALNWAWKQPCPNPTSKLVLMALADHANADGECWPAMKRIAELCGITPRQVSTHITALEAAGYVTKGARRRRDGQLRGWDYLVHSATSGSLLPVASGSTASPPAEASFRSEPPENRQVEPVAAAPRQRDELWDAMLTACRINPDTIPRTARGAINRAVKELREIGATPQDVEAKAAAYRKTWPEMSLTPTALAKHWAQLTAGRTATRTCECGQPLNRHDPEFHDTILRGGI
jgi:DNA-binding transcriptional ArsR family regulator